MIPLADMLAGFVCVRLNGSFVGFERGDVLLRERGCVDGWRARYVVLLMIYGRALLAQNSHVWLESISKELSLDCQL